MKKGDICCGYVEYVDFPNKGKVRLEEGAVTVKNAIPGQKIEFMINKKRSGRLEGRLLKVLEKSPWRPEIRCAAFSPRAAAACTRP